MRSLQAMELFDGLFDDETLFRGPEARPLAQWSPTIGNCGPRTEANWRRWWCQTLS